MFLTVLQVELYKIRDNKEQLVSFVITYLICDKFIITCLNNSRFYGRLVIF